MTAQLLSSANGHHNTTGNGHRPVQQGQAPGTNPRPSVIQMLREADSADRSQQPPALGFSAQQIEALSAPLNRAHISSREQGKGSVSYLKSFVVLQEANRIFGFDGWQRQTLSCRCVCQAERLIGESKRPGWGVTYIARVRITVTAGANGPLIREGTGAGHGIDTDLGLAHESAIKEAETDAMKRALVTFGNPFGLALYDKSQRQVTGAPSGQGQAQPRGAQTRQGRGIQPRQGQQASGSHHPQPNSRQAIQRPQASGSQATQRPASLATARPQASARPQAQAQAQDRPQPPATRSAPQATNGHQPQPASPDALLDPAIALQLQEQLKALSPRHRDAFSRAFRTAFQVPDSTPSVAGLIRQERHRIWIQEFLAKATRG